MIIFEIFARFANDGSNFGAQNEQKKNEYWDESWVSIVKKCVLLHAAPKMPSNGQNVSHLSEIANCAGWEIFQTDFIHIAFRLWICNVLTAFVCSSLNRMFHSLTIEYYYRITTINSNWLNPWMNLFECMRFRLHLAIAIAMMLIHGTRLLADSWFYCRIKRCKQTVKIVHKKLFNGRSKSDLRSAALLVQHLNVPFSKRKLKKKLNTYSVVNDFRPLNASWAMREMLLLDKSMRRNRLKLANAFGVISVMKFCSSRL